MWGPDNTASSLLGNPPWLRFPLALSECNCNCMMVSDSHNYTQLTRDNLVTERYHNSAHQPLSAKSFLPPLCIPGCLLLYRPSNCYFCHKASHVPTPQQDTCVQGNDWRLEWYKLFFCKSVGWRRLCLLVCQSVTARVRPGVESHWGE